MGKSCPLFLGKQRAALFLAELGEGGGGYGLAYPAGFLVGEHDLALAGKLRIFLFQHGGAGIQNDIAAFAGHDTAHEHQVLNVVEVGVENNSVGQIHADVPENLRGPGIVLSHQLLDNLQLLCGGQLGV